MSTNAFYGRIRNELRDLESQGLTKPERVALSRQGTNVSLRTDDGRTQQALNFCANNYLGLGGDQRVAEAAIRATRDAGAGLASVRFICGTHSLHKDLEAAIADYLGYEDAILFAAAFDANGGVVRTPARRERRHHLRQPQPRFDHRWRPAVQGQALPVPQRRHDGLEDALKQARAEAPGPFVIATDGVFSMDGHIADLDTSPRLAGQYDALVMVDDCHATGFLGPKGRGSAAFRKRGRQGRFPVGHLRQGAGWGHGRLHLLRERKSWRCCVSGRGLICSPTPWRRRSAARRWKPSPSRSRTKATSCATNIFDNAARFRTRHARGRLHADAGRTSHHSRHAGRRPPGAGHGGQAAGRRHLCHRLFLPRRAQGPGPHPHPAVGRPYARTCDRAVAAFTKARDALEKKSDACALVRKAKPLPA